jgi:hypothetical protein
LAVVAAGTGGIVLVDVSDPARPIEVDGHSIGDEVHAVAVDGDLVYVAARPAMLSILRIRRDARPTPVGTSAATLSPPTPGSATPTTGTPRTATATAGPTSISSPTPRQTPDATHALYLPISQNPDR